MILLSQARQTNITTRPRYLQPTFLPQHCFRLQHRFLIQHHRFLIQHHCLLLLRFPHFLIIILALTPVVHPFLIPVLLPLIRLLISPPQHPSLSPLLEDFLQFHQ
jgi:hypothetical protein